MEGCAEGIRKSAEAKRDMKKRRVHGALGFRSVGASTGIPSCGSSTSLRLIAGPSRAAIRADPKALALPYKQCQALPYELEVIGRSLRLPHLA